MVKISDIFRKEEGSPEDSPKMKPQEPLVFKPSPAQDVKPQVSPEKAPAQIMKEKIKVEDVYQTTELYHKTVDLVKEILDKGRRNEPIEVKTIKDHAERIVDQLAAGNAELIGMVKNSTPENYLYGHCTNICILSVVVGLGLGYDHFKLMELGVAALLHDIGMIRVSDIAEKPSKLSKEEYEKIKQHPLYGVEILGLSKDITQAVIYVTQEHHEWVNGSGYPKGLKDKEINEYAKIVGTVDMYEALTHPRTHRNKLIPFDAMRHLLRNKEHFMAEYLRVLIESVGIYPMGSWVELNNGEIGKVIKINKENPLRPIIEITVDPQGKKLAEPKPLDLSAVPSLHIKNPIDETELKL